MTEFLVLLKSGPAVSAATVAAVAAVIKMLKALFEFNDEHLQKRQLKKLAFLAKECENSNLLHRLVQTARDEEVFRNIFGRTGTPQFVEAISLAHESGKVSLSELRISSFYLDVKDGRLVVVLGWVSHLLFWTSVGLIVIMSFYIAVLLFLLFRVPSASSYLAGAIIISFYFLFAWSIGSEVRAVLVAKRVRKKLVVTENEA